MSERADLLRWLATRAREREDLLSAAKLNEAAAATEHEMRVLQQTLRGSREQND